jgi:anti-sigma regulatory factor (Ser/Thr protein kinase)
MTAVRRFPLAPESVRAARRFAVESLASYPDRLVAIVELLVSELATNAIRHARAGFTLRIDVDAARVQVEVTDSGGGTPVMQSPGTQGLSGRGLRIVELFSTAWGTRQERDGASKTVWFTLPIG